MGTFKAYFKKEILESIRQYRYIILVVGIIFFAISGPIMMKMLPEILKTQVKGDFSSLFVVTPTSVLQNYIKDLFQIGAIIIVFTLSGSLSDGITNEKFVFPYAKGCSPAGIVLSKILHYGIVITFLTIGGFLINNYYTNILIKGEAVPLNNVLLCSGLISLYFLFNIILVMFFSSVLKKGIVSGFLTLGILYFSTLLSNINVIGEFIPYRLIQDANLLSFSHTSKSIIIILVYCLILVFFTIYRMSRIEYK